MNKGKNKSISFICLGLGICFILSISSCSLAPSAGSLPAATDYIADSSGFRADANTQTTEQQVIAMDTVASLRLISPDSQTSALKIISILAELDTQLNHNSTTSDIAILNQPNQEIPVEKLSPYTMGLLRLSEEYSSITDGYWDITAGRLINCWSFDKKSPHIATSAELAAALQQSGWQKLHIGDTILKDTPELTINAGGIAKGYALDIIRDYLDTSDSSAQGLISLGTSSIYARGINPDRGTAWNIALRNPRNSDTPMAIISLQDEIISVSGDYERYFIAADGKRYHHILDPHTGLPNQDIMEVFVILPANTQNAGALSDAMSTAIFAAGTDKAREILSKIPASNNIKAGILTSDYTLYLTENLQNNSCIADINNTVAIRYF